MKESVLGTMSDLSLYQILLAFAAAFVAGAINSVAGGGTLVSFPALVMLGVPSVIANATNTVAMWPGSMGSMWGYRAEMKGLNRRLLLLVIPSLIGGIIGAVLLRITPPGVFDRLVPILILFATLPQHAQDAIQKRLKISNPNLHTTSRWLWGATGFQFLVALYGGYFGAGIGILMLAALGIMGLTDIHQMNGLKNIFASCINGIAAIYFATTGLVSWPYATVMILGAVCGGYLGAGAARKLGRQTVKRLVVVIGFSMALALFVRSWF